MTELAIDLESSITGVAAPPRAAVMKASLVVVVLTAGVGAVVERVVTGPGVEGVGKGPLEPVVVVVVVVVRGCDDGESIMILGGDDTVVVIVVGVK